MELVSNFHIWWCFYLQASGQAVILTLGPFCRKMLKLFFTCLTLSLVLSVDRVEVHQAVITGEQNEEELAVLRGIMVLLRVRQHAGGYGDTGAVQGFPV